MLRISCLRSNLFLPPTCCYTIWLNVFWPSSEITISCFFTAATLTVIVQPLYSNVSTNWRPWSFCLSVIETEAFWFCNQLSLFCFEIIFPPLFAAFTLSACHLVGTVSSWARRRLLTSSTSAQEAGPLPWIRPPHHWDSCGCCGSAASRPPSIPITTCTAATVRAPRAPQLKRKTRAGAHRGAKRDDGTCSVWTWWRSFRVWVYTEW